MEKRIEILVSNEAAAKALVSLIMSDEVKEMFARIDGQINGFGIFDAGQGIEEEAEDAQTTEA